MAGDEDYLLDSAFFRKLSLEGRAIEVRQPDVEYDARWPGGRRALQILHRAGKRLYPVVLRRKQGSEARPNRLIIIDHEHASFRLFRSCRPATDCDNFL